MTEAKPVLFLTLTTLGRSIFGTGLLHQHQQWALGISCVSREEGLQCKNQVHREQQQVRPGNRTTIKWCEWTNKKKKVEQVLWSLHLLKPTSYFSSDVWHCGRHHQVSLHIPNNTHQWEKYARSKMPRKLCADVSSNEKGCWPAAAITHEPFQQRLSVQSHLVVTQNIHWRSSWAC